MRLVFQETFDKALASHNDNVSLTYSRYYNKSLCFSLSPKLDKNAECFFYIIETVNDDIEHTWKHDRYLLTVDTIASLFIIKKNLPHIYIETSLRALIETFIDHLLNDAKILNELQSFMDGNIKILENALLNDNLRFVMMFLSTWIFTIDNHIDDSDVILCSSSNESKNNFVGDCFVSNDIYAKMFALYKEIKPELNTIPSMWTISKLGVI